MLKLLQNLALVAGLAAIASSCEGTPGAKGADGADGADGTNGQDGTDGANGQDGADGQDGTDGADGQDAETDYSDINLYAAHDPASAQYRSDCLSCHESVITEVSADAAVDTFHVGMLKYLNPTWNVPDDVTDDACQYCHAEGVDLMNGSAGAIRRQVSIEDECFMCHQGGGTYPLYNY